MSNYTFRFMIHFNLFHYIWDNIQTPLLIGKYWSNHMFFKYLVGSKEKYYG